MSATRREFLKDASRYSMGLGLLTFDPTLLKAMKRRVSPNVKINLGLIGARGMGFGILRLALKQPETQCVALCDIDDKVLEDRLADVLELQDTKPKVYKDFRVLLDDQDVDAVIIGTPDHWHCLTMVHACEAGKDVYVEKPMANSLAELDVMVGAARKYQRVVQVGQQQRSGEHWQQIMKHIKSGRIGQLRKINIWANFNYGVGQPKVADAPIPEGVDFDMWLGPAPYRSFNRARFHGSWRMFWDYGGGLVTDWGVHLIDMALWAKDINKPPDATVSAGGNFSHQDCHHETFDTLSVTWQLKDVVLNWESLGGLQTGPYDKTYGLAFIGNKGTIVANREGWSLNPEMEKDQPKTEAISEQPGKSYHEDHVRNFLECIKTRKDPNCPVEVGRLSAQYAHMGNIALRTQSRLLWNVEKRKFVNNKEANKLIRPEYRKPWSLPTI